MTIGREMWEYIYLRGAVWHFAGDHRAPHVRLRSGKHSDGFIDTLQYLSITGNLYFSAGLLVRDMLKPVINERVDWVIGSPMAAIQFAGAVGHHLKARRVGFTEKVGEKDLVCRFDMEPGSTVLQIEEMSTSGGTPQRSIDAILARNPEVHILPYVGAFLIRCGQNPPELRSATFVPLINLTELGVIFAEWEPDECPLCKGGSRAITNAKKVWPDLLQTMGNPLHQIPGAEFATP